MLGLVTLLNVTVCEPDGAVALAALRTRSEPAVDVLAVQPLAAPKPVGWLPRVEPVIVKPAGVVHVPDAVVQAWKAIDLIAVAPATVKLKA